MRTDIRQVALGPAARIVADDRPYFFSHWKPVFAGVERAVGTADLAFGLATPVRRKQYVNVVRVNLATPGVRFLTSSGAEASEKNGRTLGATISEFMAMPENAEVVLAINANFSWYNAPTDQSGAEFVLFGAAVRAGQVVCDPAKQPWTQGITDWEGKQVECGPCFMGGGPGCDVPGSDWAGAAALLITEYNGAHFALATAQDPVDLARYHTAIAGSAPPLTGSLCPQRTRVPLTLLYESGHDFAVPAEDPPEGVAGRTAVGLGTEDGVRYLFLATLDGREGAPYPYGGAFYDLLSWMQIAGADAAMPLDGGGSSVMAWRADDGTIVHAGVPYGDEQTPGLERAVGNFFGVVAPRLGA